MTAIDRLTTHAPRAIALGLISALTFSLASPFFVLQVAASSAPGTDHSARVTTSEVSSALRHTTGVLQDSSSVKNDSDTTAALKTATVDIPKDASDGVTLAAADGPSLDITLPNAAQSDDGQQVAPGVVAYAANNGSANAVQAESDGSVRMLTVIDNSSAPTTYDYGVTVPDGGFIEVEENGSAQVMSDEGTVVATVALPWATDAKGKSIKTWFTTDGTTLVQHIKHRIRNVAYPITADPSISYGWNVYINFTRSETAVVEDYREAGDFSWNATGLACAKLPTVVVKGACAVVIFAKASQLSWAVRSASETNSCLQMAVPYYAMSNPALMAGSAWFGWVRC